MGPGQDEGTDPRLGRLTRPLDEAALADAMLYYCDNLDEERKAAAFRRSYIQRFNADAVVHVHAQALTAVARRVRDRKRSRALRTADEGASIDPVLTKADGWEA